MSAATKLFLVLVAFVCCVQLAEMARLRRDAPAPNIIDDLSAAILKATKGFTEAVEDSTVIKEFREKFNNLSSDDVKLAIDDAGKTTKENLDKFQDFFKNIIDAVGKEVKSD